MKTLITLVLFLTFLCLSIIAQEEDITEVIPIKIYSIEFVDFNNGWAESIFGEILITTDGGQDWHIKTGAELEKIKAIIKAGTGNGWSADIYCEVMQSTDCGENWMPYPKKQEEHFCAVYFKDENTGWKVAEEFLQKVVDTITVAMRDNTWEQKIDLPHKCREYYTDIITGWSVGWCFKNLISEGI
jgi:photosystem II stability/assembly factor-like uncharacterized protein